MLFSLCTVIFAFGGVFLSVPCATGPRIWNKIDYFIWHDERMIASTANIAYLREAYAGRHLCPSLRQGKGVGRVSQGVCCTSTFEARFAMSMMNDGIVHGVQ